MFNLSKRAENCSKVQVSFQVSGRNTSPNCTQNDAATDPSERKSFWPACEEDEGQLLVKLNNYKKPYEKTVSSLKVSSVWTDIRVIKGVNEESLDPVSPCPAERGTSPGHWLSLAAAASLLGIGR